jgi:four helix bundle protein
MSVALNIAEGSTGQTDAEQARFVGLAIRSTVSTVACIHIIQRRKLTSEIEQLRQAYRHADKLTAKLQSLRRTISPERKWLREENLQYTVDDSHA